MVPGPQGRLILILLFTLLAIHARISQARTSLENGVKTNVYLSPKITLQPGSVSNKFYYDIDFPRGHIAIKSFNAEVIDEAGNPVPLQETYLHHWVTVRYYQRKGVNVSKHDGNIGFHKSNTLLAGNAGVCNHGLSQFFGLGSETRRTATHIPDPYGIEAGNPSEIPTGYEEKWLLNIHAIDTRGAENRMGCTECRCNLYNVTEDEDGRPLKENYIGGLYCCYDGTQCKVKNGLEIVKRNVYLRYTVKWVDWNDSILPVSIYIFDVTDKWTKSTRQHDCLIEYDIEPCTTGAAIDGCTDIRSVSVGFPAGGDLIYGVAHQHSGGIGSALYGEDGRVICESQPTYGTGKDAGNEAGYIVGMSTCYPKPGSVKIANGEILTLVSNFSSAQKHTGVMGLFYILLAEPSSELNASVEIHQESKLPMFFWGVAVLGVAIAAAVAVAYQRRRQREDGYQSIAT